jgi:uncharacterized protein (TIGR03663 family)
VSPIAKKSHRKKNQARNKNRAAVRTSPVTAPEKKSTPASQQVEGAGSPDGFAAKAPKPRLTRALDAELSDRTWYISAAAILIIGAFLRLYDLPLVPMHHDEGVNGNFLVGMVRNGISNYKYNPTNYHGPSLYFFSAIIPWIWNFIGGPALRDSRGLTTFNVRFVTVVFGVATIWLALLLRKRLGAMAALSAAGLLAISPGAVYLSRYFIHETLFAFFMLGIVVAALKYYDTRNAVYLLLAATSAALMVATKETWIINGPVLLIALVSTAVYFYAQERFFGKRKKKGPNLIDQLRQQLNRFGSPAAIITVALFAVAIFIVVNVLLYSSFFTNYPQGVKDALQTLNLWSQRTHEHEHPWNEYIIWMLQEESMVLLLAVAGALIALWRANNRLALFLATVSFGLLAAYSLVGYKTPWITINFIVPCALVGGYALGAAYHKFREFQQPVLIVPLFLLILAVSGYQMYDLNFVHYDDDHYPYVYAHTRRETLAMLDEIDRLSKRLGTGYDTGITIASPDHWPLPWYFRDYKHVGFFGHIVPTTEPIIIGSLAQKEELRSTYGDRYQQIDSHQLNDPRVDPAHSTDGGFELRPGVTLLLYVRKDVPR